MKTIPIAMAILFALAVTSICLTVSRFNLSALPEPGGAEMFLAGKVRHLYVSRGSREAIPPAPPNIQASVEEGDKLFGTECGECHGSDGHKPTDAGRWMYPRAADLASAEVQRYSDRELFWIVKNGIRFSGMPAFGNVETDVNIWSLVRYLRTLPEQSNPGK